MYPQLNDPTPKPTPLIHLNQVTKRFGGTVALDGIDFTLNNGEIHALLGENGAGKSTLIKILAGIHQPDEGGIVINGEPVTLNRVSDADQHGIRVIHQELSLAPNLDIAENIYLGREPQRYGFLARREMYRSARELVNRLGLTEISEVGKPVSELSVARQQLVEIARALSCSAKALILDEPTSSLSESETEILFNILKRLRSLGVGIIYISHRLEEIARIADRITVLRDGKSIGAQSINELDQPKLIRWMVGRELTDVFHRPQTKPSKTLFAVKDLNTQFISNVSLHINVGEIVGLAGLVGSGRSEIARAIFGVDPIQSGEIWLEDRKITIRNPQDALRAGIVLAPEDRRREGLVMIQSVLFNLTLPWLRLWNRGALPSYKKRREIAQRAVSGFNVRLSSLDQSVYQLSGGNQQKALVGKWMEERPKVLILDEPARGVDVGAREEMFRIISNLAQEGMAVLLISSDLAEVTALSHCIALVRGGTIIKTVPTQETSLEQILSDLTGAGNRENH